jgi:nucleoside-diphosphate-sugar epimerase
MAESHGHGNHSGEAMDIKHVLVTGATGFLGAHVVDALLEGGFRVRAGTRSLDRGHQLLDARPQARDTGRLEVIRIGDFAGGDGDELDFWDAGGGKGR